VITVYLLPIVSLTCSKRSPRSSRDFRLFVSPPPSAPLASCIPVSVGPWPVWAVSTLSLLSPTKSPYFRLLPSKYQLSSGMSKVDLTMSAQTSWLLSSPEEVSQPTLLHGSSLSSPTASADLYSKPRRRFAALSLLAPLKALLFVLYITSLHPSIPQGLAISYVDDLTITVGSDSVRSNIRGVQYFFRIIQRPGANLGVAFSVPKLNSFTGEPRRTARMFPLPPF